MHWLCVQLCISALQPTIALSGAKGDHQVPKGPLRPWKFSLVKSIAYHNTQQSHELQAETSSKMDALQWIKAKTAGAMLDPGEDAETAEAALNDVMPYKRKRKAEIWPYKTKMKMKRRMEKDRMESWRKLLMRQKSCLTWARTSAGSMLPKGYRRC